MKISAILSRFALLLIGIFFSTFCKAQSFYKDGNLRTSSLSIGVGPSFMYSDNGGVFKVSDFNWSPAFSIAYAKKIHSRLAIQTTGGVQFVRSGGQIRDYAIKKWEETGGAFSFKGQAYFLDLTPVFYVIPYDNHMNRGRFNAYFGSGFGIVHVNRTETFSFEDNATEFSANTTSTYIPVLLGFSFSLDQFSDLSLELKGMFTFSDELDGNQGYNEFNDHLFQTQIVYKRLLSRRF